MRVVCPSCGQENPDGFRFCGACGEKLRASPQFEERKVVTVLFCDLVGSTAQAERLDPEDVRALLSRYHERVKTELERFGGTVEKFIGDAVMALFGAPVAHEDDPERAVRAALAVRDWAEEDGEVQVRIGITTGETLVVLGARPEQGEGMAAGDVVNTAARLQSAAPENAVLVDETTYRATERAIDYESQVSVAAKGKAQPVPAWRAAQARSRFGTDVRQIGHTPLVGRVDELGVLVNALVRAKREREPQLVTVVGVPGIGKSRLVWELFRTVENSDELTRWRQGRSLPYGEGASFWALGEMVKAEAGILETDAAEETSRKLERALHALPLDEHEWVARHLRPLVGLGAETELGRDVRQEAFAAWRLFLEALADHRPTVLVFEDLHWADEEVLDFVDHLADRARGVPLLVVATARPELLDRRPAWGGGKANAATLSLAPLSDDETGQLVHALLDRSALATEVRATLLDRAAGNPLYAEEFVRLFEEQPGAATLPESVQGIIAARLDALPDAEKELVQDAAVLGKVFWLGGLVEGRTRWAVEELLNSLERKEFVRRDRRSSVAGEVEYAFRHALVREVAYKQIPRGRRAQKHLAAASWVESLGRAEDHAEMLAHHYVSAVELRRAVGEPDDTLVVRARAACAHAGDRALALNAFRAAARLYGHALELSPASDGRGDFLLRFGTALHRAADKRAEEVLEQAAEQLVAAGQPLLAAEAQVILSEVAWDRGDRDVATSRVDRAVAVLAPGESEAKARVLARAARLQSIAGHDREALATAGDGLAIAERLGVDDVRTHLLITVGTSRFELGDVARGLADLERSVEIALAAGSYLAGNGLNNLGFMHSKAGNVARDRELRYEALRVAERFGDERMARFVRLCLPMLDFYAGEWETALADAEAFAAELDAGFSHYLEPNVRWTLACLHLFRGEEDSAIEAAARSVRVARAAKDPQMILPALAVGLRVELELGRLDRAEELAGEILSCSPAHEARSPAVELAWSAGRLDNADDVRAWIRRIPHRSRWTDAALAVLDGRLEEAAELFELIGSRPDAAYARLKASEQRLAEGRRSEARAQLEQALSFFRGVGAARYIAEVEALVETMATASSDQSTTSWRSE